MILSIAQASYNQRVRNGDARMRWACLALLALPYLYYLSASGIFGPDEARYAAIGLNMAKTGDWVTPVLWGAPWFEKPPLLYWLIASFSSLGLPAEWAIRLPVALLGLGLAAAMPSLEAMLVLATSVGWLALSQVAVTDIPLSVCFHGFVLLLLRGRPWGAGVCLGLGILAKGMVPLVLGLPLVWRYRREWRHWVAAVVVAGPWYALCYARNGQVFFEEFLWKHHVGRFFSSELQHVQPFWFYVPILAVVLLPWTPALWMRKVEEEERPLVEIVVWSLVFLSLSKNKLPAYILPVLPSLAMLLGPRVRRGHFVFAAGLFAFLPAWAAWVGPTIDQGLSKAAGQPVAWGFLAVAVGAAALAWRWPRATVLASFVLAVVSLKTQVYPALAGSVSAKGRVKVCVPEGASRGFRYSLYFYAEREVPDCPAATP